MQELHSHRRFQKLSPFNGIVGFWIGIVLALFYIIVGCLFIFFAEQFFPNVPRNLRNFFGGIMIAYGIFRMIRSYGNYRRYLKEKNNPLDEN